LAARGLCSAVVNARQVRDFAMASGQLAKSDRIDEQHTVESKNRLTANTVALPSW